MTELERFNMLPATQAEHTLLPCCGSHAWAQGLAALRPFATPKDLFEAAREVWLGLTEDDWLEAFACHPRIGERIAQAEPARSPDAPAGESRSGERATPANATEGFAAHSTSEQQAVHQTIAGVDEALRAGNAEYEQRFGFRYLVFASGRTAPELFALLEERLTHARAQELREAARQQERITQLRLERWLQV